MTTDSFDAWLRANPAPNLQALVERAGRRYAASIGEDYDPLRHAGYPRITPAEWAEFDRATAEWQARRRERAASAQSAEAPSTQQSDPQRLCICGLPGVHMRPRRGGGRPIWRCAAHADRWPDYAEVPGEVPR